MGEHILIVEDDPNLLSTLEELFKREGYKVSIAKTGTEAIKIINNSEIDLVVSDLMIPGISGMELLQAISDLKANCQFIMITAYGTIETAIEAIKKGAYDFITKPVNKNQLLKTVRLALERQQLINENKKLKEKIKSLESSDLIGNSLPFREMMEKVKNVAQSEATVLLTGESGTGKDVIARYIHNQSPRSNKSYIPINCAAIPENLLESELFGHTKGAFTGADRDKKGRFELADGGTILLDEISEMPLSLQAKLLRVIEDKVIDIIGGHSKRVDIRFIAATNKDLQQLVKDGRFREDLFYRLNVINIRIPPLRERMEDIPLLAMHFVNIFSAKYKKEIKSMSPETLTLLQSYQWPGNIRELQNQIEKAIVLCKGDELKPSDFTDIRVDGIPKKEINIPIGMPLDEIEKIIISETLKLTKGDKNLAAKLLGIATRTIYRKINPEEQ
ncbi:MAG: sigma-54 dependent transcriptional regulator [Deltaproteobacteria bacterium]|nr:sigma-54 dependent transcriptional regulator [Deltaproteobacteria bacterium]